MEKFKSGDKVLIHSLIHNKYGRNCVYNGNWAYADISKVHTVNTCGSFDFGFGLEECVTLPEAKVGGWIPAALLVNARLDFSSHPSETGTKKEEKKYSFSNGDVCVVLPAVKPKGFDRWHEIVGKTICIVGVTQSILDTDAELITEDENIYGVNIRPSELRLATPTEADAYFSAKIKRPPLPDPAIKMTEELKELDGFKLGEKVRVVRTGHGFAGYDHNKIVTIRKLSRNGYLGKNAAKIEEKYGNELTGNYDGWVDLRSFSKLSLSTFKVGDRVKLIENKAHSINNVGDRGIITEINRSSARVDVDGKAFGNVVNWSYFTDLELITQDFPSIPLKPKIAKFIVGNIVVITGNTPHCINNIGDIGRVEEVDSEGMPSAKVYVKGRIGVANWSYFDHLRLANEEERTRYINTLYTGYAGPGYYYDESLTVTRTNVYIGMRVKRGPRWRWGNQGEGASYGKVVGIYPTGSLFINVIWINDGPDYPTSYFSYGDGDLAIVQEPVCYKEDLKDIPSAPLLKIEEDDVKMIPYKEETYRLIKID